jgi:type IV secretory pathway TrbD component
MARRAIESLVSFLSNVQLEKKHSILIGAIFVSVFLVFGLGLYVAVQSFDYYYNTGGTITLEPREYQCWPLPDSHPLDLQRPRWKGVAEQDTFSVYFGPDAQIASLIANFTVGLPLDAFSEYILANETYYFNSWISIPTAGNWSIIMINPHTYAISVENSLTSLTYPSNLWMVAIIGVVVCILAISYARSNRRTHPRMEFSLTNW